MKILITQNNAALRVVFRNLLRMQKVVALSPGDYDICATMSDFYRQHEKWHPVNLIIIDHMMCSLPVVLERVRKIDPVSPIVVLMGAARNACTSQEDTAIRVYASGSLEKPVSADTLEVVLKEYYHETRGDQAKARAGGEETYSAPG
jgi:DNA-binding NtrC family response regulator